MEYKVNNLMYAAGNDLHNTIRTGIEMTEPVTADALRKAADLTIKRYPYFSVKLAKKDEKYVLIHNDAPLPDDPVETKPLGSNKTPEDVFMLDEQPEGYESRDKWTSFRVKVRQMDMMMFASSVDGSPATFIGSVMYRAICDLHPDNKLPIVCGMQHQYRKALGKPQSHLCHVNIVPITYTDKMRNRDIELLNIMARGTIIVRADDANNLLSVNAHIENERRIKEFTLTEKHDYMKEFLLNGIGRNTFEVSYTGRVPFSGLDKYISDFYPILDMSLSGGISIEIFTVGDNFCINIMQRNNDRRYTERFIGLLAEKGIKCVSETQEHFEINDFVLPE